MRNGVERKSRRGRPKMRAANLSERKLRMSDAGMPSGGAEGRHELEFSETAHGTQRTQGARRIQGGQGTHGKGRPWLGVLLSYAARCRGKMAASLACSIASVAIGLIPYAAVFHVMAMLMDGGSSQAGSAFATMPTGWADGEARTLICWLLVGAAGYVLSKVMFGISTILSHISAYTILESLRLDVVEKLMRTSLGTAASKSIGQVKNVFIDRIEGIEIPLAHMIPELSGNALLTLCIAVWLVAIDWRFALACLASVPIGLVVFGGSLAAYNKMYARYMEQSNQVNSVMVEYIEGIAVVKAFNQTSDSYQKYARAIESFKDFTLAWFKSTWVGMNLASSIMPTTLLGALPCGLALYLAGLMTPSELASALVLALAVVPPVMRLSTFLNEAKSMEYAVADADEFLLLPELDEPDCDAEVEGSAVDLSHVSFAYAHGVDVLHDITLSIPEGSFTALVGPSGGGKSTVARLIARHWDVNAGSVRIGGVDVRNMPLDQLSSLVSYVAQDNYLFDCSLRENIRMGRADATDDEVMEAARAACCEEFITRLPHGIDTTAGEAGGALSGGERQRISIARAILKDAPVVVLDEATAFTDPENEDRIQQSIAQLTKEKTLLVIAHRLSTVVGADNIVVLDGGHVVAQGTHTQLLENCGLYAQMWRAHTGAKVTSALGLAEKRAQGKDRARQGIDGETGRFAGIADEDAEDVVAAREAHHA